MRIGNDTEEIRRCNYFSTTVMTNSLVFFYILYGMKLKKKEENAESTITHGQKSNSNVSLSDLMMETLTGLLDHKKVQNSPNY